MTMRPTPIDFARPDLAVPPRGVALRPKVEDRFWGYEVYANEEVIDLAVLMRATCGILTFACFLASLGVWVMPAMAFVAKAFVAKATLSVLLMCITLILARVAARGTRVRVQVDTAKGELREVVAGPFGSDMILARHGLDAVQSVDFVASRGEPSFGQIQITVNGVGVVPAGVGAMVLLGPLRDRLAEDCGVEAVAQARPAVWGGPLAA